LACSVASRRLWFQGGNPSYRPRTDQVAVTF